MESDCKYCSEKLSKLLGKKWEKNNVNIILKHSKPISTFVVKDIGKYRLLGTGIKYILECTRCGKSYETNHKGLIDMMNLRMITN